MKQPFNCTQAKFTQAKFTQNFLNNNRRRAGLSAAAIAALFWLGLLAQPVLAQTFVAVNAASYGAQGIPLPLPVTVPDKNAADAYKRTLAPDMITAAFGTFVTQGGQSYPAATNPLPTTLGGVRLQVNAVDSPLIFVSPTQINFVIPSNLNDSTNVTLRVFNSNGTQATGACTNGTETGVCTIARSAPGIFSINASGAGPAAALTTDDGVIYKPVFKPDLSAADVDAGTLAKPNILVFYGTGIRRIPAANPNDANGVAESLNVTLQGVPLTVAYAGPAPGFVGLDQVNAVLPPEAIGLKLCKLIIEAKPTVSPRFGSNAVDIFMAGVLPQIRVNGGPINFDQTINGELTASDQIQLLENIDCVNDRGKCRTYFFDAYTFSTTQANQTIAIDMRRDNTGGNQLNSAALLYRIVRLNDQDTLEPLGEDDDIGSLGNGEIEVTKNALLLMVVPQAGNYAIFATSSNAQPNGLGKYSLRLSNAPIRQLTYGQNLTGETIATTDIKTSANVYLDAYYFNATSGENVDIRTTAPSYISLLVLQPNGSFPSSSGISDAGSLGGQAKVTQRIGQTGIYIIFVTPFETNKTGAYSLSLNRVSSLDDAASATAVEANVAPARAMQAGRLSGRHLSDRKLTRTIQQ